MRPVIAKRKTTCNFCKDEIDVGLYRLTDTVRIGGKDGVIRTQHYHFEKLVDNDSQNCYMEQMKAAFDRLEETKEDHGSNNPNGRPPLDLSDDDRIKRQKLLRRLSNQKRYWLAQNGLKLGLVDVRDITEKDVKRLNRLDSNIKEILAGLEDLGGIPNSHRHLQSFS